MKTVRKRFFWALLTALVLTSAALVSCNQKQDNDAEIEAMRARLNAIMLEHQQMQLDYENYTANLAAKDSAIQAQAKEIERLIGELKVAQAAASTGSTQRLNRMAADLRAKQHRIEELENSLQQQTRELAALRQQLADQNNGTANPGEIDLNAIARLQKQLDEQDRLIADLSVNNVLLTNSNDSLEAVNAYLTTHRQSSAISADNNDQYAALVRQLEGQIALQQDEITRLNAELQEQIALVAEAQSSAETAKKDAAEAKKNAKGAVNKKITELEEMCKNYAEEIARLKAENALLRSENDSLRSEVVTMRQEAEQTAVNNAKLAQKVSMAAILVTRDITVTPLKRVANNSGKETNRASAVTTLKIDGIILDNNVVDPGSIILYVRVTDPTGRLVSTPKFDGRGEIIPQEFESNGTRVAYTVAQAIEFTGESRPFTIIWNKGEDEELIAGIYKVAVFANGNIIGTSTFRLK